MFRDHSLMPKEAVRLAALGFLAEGEKTYAALANDVRHFTSRFWGPTLEVMATSIELLRFEGLTDSVDDDIDTRLCITDDGREALRELLRANIRIPVSDFNKLVLALKLRFLHFLPVSEQREQAETLVDLRQSELARLVDLRQGVDLRNRNGGASYFNDWLDHDIAQIESDLAWFEDFRDKIGADQT
jgi:DNA-binding PadR family transcriptional regulator